MEVVGGSTVNRRFGVELGEEVTLESCGGGGGFDGPTVRRSTWGGLGCCFGAYRFAPCLPLTATLRGAVRAWSGVESRAVLYSELGLNGSALVT